MSTDAHVSPGSATSVEEAPAAGAQSSLFGRGMLYVVVYAAQLLSATVVSPVLAHLLPSAQFGVLAAAISMSQVLVLLAALGLEQAIVLVRAEPDGPARARAVLAQGAVLATAVTVATWATQGWWAPAIGLGSHAALVGVVVAWTAPSAFVMLALLLLVAQDRLLAYSAVSIVMTVGAQVTGLVVLLVVSRSGSASATSYARGVVAAMLVAAVAGAVVVRPRWRGLLDLALARHALSLGVPLMVSGLATYVMNAGDRLVLAKMAGAVPVGRYQVAYTVGSVLMMLLNATSVMWSPRLTAIVDLGERWRAIRDARDGLLRLLAPAFLGLVLAAPLLLRVVAPERLHPQSLMPVVLLVAVTAIPLVFQTTAVRAQVTLRMTRTVALVAMAGATLNIALNIALIPHWGLEGSAAATTLAFTAQAVLQHLTLPTGTLSPRVPVGLAAQLALVVAVGTVCALVLPHTTAWQVGGFVAAAACSPWLLREISLLRRAV